MLSLPLLLAFLAGAGPAQPRPDVTTRPTAKVTPETRGDIFMARKMYREAVEAYKEGPKGDAVLLNKTGIAYHQMLELGAAKRYYEQAIRAKSDYAEAINNLGTVYTSPRATAAPSHSTGKRCATRRIPRLSIAISALPFLLARTIRTRRPHTRRHSRSIPTFLRIAVPPVCCYRSAASRSAPNSPITIFPRPTPRPATTTGSRIHAQVY